MLLRRIMIFVAHMMKHARFLSQEHSIYSIVMAARLRIVHLFPDLKYYLNEMSGYVCLFLKMVPAFCTMIS